MKLRVESLSFSYEDVEALSDIDFEIDSGETVSLIGPNGSGKTTLLKLCSGLLAPESGSVYLNGTDISTLSFGEIARELAVVEQEHHVGFEFTARELIEWGRLPHRSRLQRWNSADEWAVQNAIDKTRIGSFAHRSIHELSGGEKQRVFLAMALAQEPNVLLLDEPTAHLDIKYQIEILEIVSKLADHGVAVLMAIHDLQLAARVSDRVVVLSDGKLVAQGAPGDVINSQLLNMAWDIDARVLWEEDELLIMPNRVGVSL